MTGDRAGRDFLGTCFCLFVSLLTRQASLPEDIRHLKQCGEVTRLAAPSFEAKAATVACELGFEVSHLEASWRVLVVMC